MRQASFLRGVYLHSSNLPCPGSLRDGGGVGNWQLVSGLKDPRIYAASPRHRGRGHNFKAYVCASLSAPLIVLTVIRRKIQKSKKIRHDRLGRRNPYNFLPGARIKATIS